MGRIPVLISDNCRLPYAEEIAYEEFMLRISESAVQRAGVLLHDWLAGQSSEQLLERCRKARKVWEQYFSSAGFAEMMTDDLLNILEKQVPESFVVTFDTLYKQGCTALTESDYHLAEQAFRGASAIAPVRPEPYVMLGITCYSSGSPGRAESLFRQAIIFDNDCVVGYRCLGLLLNEQKLFGKAIISLSKAAILAPDSAEIARYLGDSYQGLGRNADAYHWYHKGLSLDPSDFLALLNVGVVCELLNRHDEAEAVLLRARHSVPGDYRPLMNLGVVYQGGNRLPEAEACYQKALELAPGVGTILWNLSQMKMLKGEYLEGFKLFEARFLKNDPVVACLMGLPRWSGESLRDKSILVVVEQAFGDTLQFVRYIPLLAAHGATVYLFSHHLRLNSLLKSIVGLAGIIKDRDKIPLCDYGVPLLSLPMLFGSTLDNLPATVPYLTAGKEAVSAWYDCLASDSCYRVGIAWKGREKPDPRRSAPLSGFEVLFQIPGISIYSLQAGEDSVDTDLPADMNIHDTGKHLSSFDDTAGLMMNLDLVITIDSAVAHLAGGLGRNTWVLLPFAPDWRWMLERRDSPWYPTLSLFRQKTPGDWHSVFQDVAYALRKVLRT